jgi:hypothetical protein
LCQLPAEFQVHPQQELLVQMFLLPACQYSPLLLRWARVLRQHPHQALLAVGAQAACCHQLLLCCCYCSCRWRRCRYRCVWQAPGLQGLLVLLPLLLLL